MENERERCWRVRLEERESGCDKKRREKVREIERCG